jgi:hypothetical protein
VHAAIVRQRDALVVENEHILRRSDVNYYYCPLQTHEEID